MTLKGGTSQACAACKYQRRKCTSECALAPYFPPDQPKMFQNAHRLFGVRNISKILEELDPSQKMEAMRSIIYQANIRDRFPVHGCLGVILQYQYQIRQLEEELHAVHAQLALCRQHEMSSASNDTSQLQLQLGMSQLQLGMSQLQVATSPSANGLALLNQETPQHYNPVNALPIASHPSYSYNGAPAGYIDSKDNNLVNSFWIQQPCVNGDDSNDQMDAQTQLIDSQSLNIQQDVIQDYEFFDAINDRQSYIDSKDTSRYSNFCASQIASLLGLCRVIQRNQLNI